MKKILLTLGLAFGIVTSASAFTASMTLTNGQWTNFSGINPGPVTITQIIMQYTNVAALQLYDSPNGQMSFTNLAYTNTLTYATNVTNANTNYYGVTNYFTNVVLIDNTNNANPATTNNFPLRMQLSVTNGTVIADHVNYYFLNGLWITNTSTGAANIAGPTVTVTYTQ